MQNKRKTGFENETVAAEYLAAKGYEIISRNFICKSGEIDIIAKENGYLVFIEVKFRRNLKKGYPSEAVDFRKQQRIIKAARYYMYKNSISEDVPCRFDVVALLGDEIEILQAAFEL